ncbi:MAG: hypothetical protein AVDCRST_MAG26-3480, partial [uncultured Chloroflexia bacterium]
CGVSRGSTAGLLPCWPCYRQCAAAWHAACYPRARKCWGLLWETRWRRHARVPQRRSSAETARFARPWLPLRRHVSRPNRLRASRSHSSGSFSACALSWRVESSPRR